MLEAKLIILRELGSMDWDYRDFVGNIKILWGLTWDFTKLQLALLIILYLQSDQN